MKRIISLFCLLVSLITWAQQPDILLNSELQALVQQGWKIQHETISYDRRTIYFSALAPGQTQYDIYTCTREKNQWSAPKVMSTSVCSNQDELWPSISADEQELYFVRVTPADPKQRKSVAKQDIYVSRRGETDWETAEALIFSDGACTSPCMATDGVTLFFASCSQHPDTKHPQWGIYMARKSNKYNWLLPAEVVYPDQEGVNLYGARITTNTQGKSELIFCRQIVERRDTTYLRETLPLSSQFVPLPHIQCKGVIRDANQRPLKATIQVSDAITATRLASHTSNPGNGQYDIALPHGHLYNIDVSAPGYSHRYLSFDATQLQHDSLVQQDIQLVNSLAVQVNLFDAETNLPVKADKVKMNAGNFKFQGNTTLLTLPINTIYKIDFLCSGYESAHLELDTRKQVLLPTSTLDIELKPGKTSLRANVFDAGTEEPIVCDIILTNKSREERITMQSTANVRQGDRYQISINHVGYLYFDTIVQIPLSEEPLLYDIPLQQLRQEVVLQLKNIQFELASADLDEESFEELDKVVYLLQNNPNISIELSAHTDDQGADSFNNLLSQRRGEAVRKYLLRQGISAERVSARGYGKTRPLVPNTSEENRAKNRRVEIKVIDVQ